MKDIAILLQSRDNPSGFKTVIDMLYNTCSSKTNFDIIAFIDEDQKEIYDYIKPLYPDIIWIYPEYLPGSWYNLIIAQHDFVKNNDYYFVWTLTDDFWGLSKDWDTAMLDKKYHFKDDIFTMHQSKENCHGRFQWIFDNSYIVDDMKDSESLFAHCELLPIHTKKWIELMSPIFKDRNYTSQQELITASLVLLLRKRFNINRMVRCDLSWMDLKDSRGSEKIFNKDGKSRTSAFKTLSQDWLDLEPILENILKEIKK
jgi:hypothetical protein